MATNYGPKCLYCDKPIQRQKARGGLPETWKGYGLPSADDNAPPYFCSLRCGMHFGTVVARDGVRITRDGMKITGGYRA